MEIPGINPDMMVHHLNIDPNYRPVQKKMRVFNPDRYEAIQVEVEKFKQARFIEEVMYSTWHANIVLVKKGQCLMEGVCKFY